MTSYTKSTNFATKDTLTSGDPLKIVKGTEINTEFDNIQTAVNSKADTASPTFTGTTTIPTLSVTGASTFGTTITYGGITLTAAVTGTGKMVLDTSPTLITPVLGVATATSINKLTLTTPATSATLTIADGASLVTSGAYSLTLTSTAATNVTLPTTGTLSTIAGSETLTSKTLTTPVLTNPTVTNYVESVVSIGNSSTTQTLSLTNGTVQTVTMTGNCTFTMPTATAGKSFILIAVQDGTGSRTGTFTSVKWAGGSAPTLTTTATTGRDIFAFVSDGTNWYGTVAQAFA